MHICPAARRSWRGFLNLTLFIWETGILIPTSMIVKHIKQMKYLVKRQLLLGRKAMTNLDSILKNRDITLPTKVRIVKAMVFPVVMYTMWELDHKAGLALKSWCFRTVVLEKTLGSPLDCKEIKPVNPKGNQPWIFIGRSEVEAEAPIFWPPDAKSRLAGKDSDAGKDWRQEEKRVTDDEMVGWHHRLNRHEIAQNYRR